MVIRKLLAEMPLTYKPLEVLTRNSFSKTKLAISAELYARYCRYKWENDVFTWQDYCNIHNKYWKNFYFNIQCKTLSASETEQIIEKVKQTGVLNPSLETFRELEPLIRKAYEYAREKC